MKNKTQRFLVIGIVSERGSPSWGNILFKSVRMQFKSEKYRIQN